MEPREISASKRPNLSSSFGTVALTSSEYRSGVLPRHIRQKQRGHQVARLTSTPDRAMLQEMTYPGGKNGAGIFQRLISLMPPHDCYIEPFLGGGAVMRLKRPAALNIGVDLDPEVIRAWQRARDHPSPVLPVSADPAVPGDARRRRSPKPAIADPATRRQYHELISLELPVGPAKFLFRPMDALEFLRCHQFTDRTLIYADPPYLHSTRGRKDVYACEMTDAQHADLLDVLKQLPCMVMLSGYASKLYTQKLKGWNSTSFQAMTRSGHMATEWLWTNFPEPVALHDYRYLGEGFRERERIKRKKTRWVKRLERMPMLEKRALLSAIEAIA